MPPYSPALEHIQYILESTKRGGLTVFRSVFHTYRRGSNAALGADQLLCPKVQKKTYWSRGRSSSCIDAVNLIAGHIKTVSISKWSSTTNLGGQSSSNGFELKPIDIRGSSWRRKISNFCSKDVCIGVTLGARSSEIPDRTNSCAGWRSGEVMRAHKRITAGGRARSFQVWGRQVPNIIGDILDIIEDGRDLGHAR